VNFRNLFVSQNSFMTGTVNASAFTTTGNVDAGNLCISGACISDWSSVNQSSGLANIVEDTTPQLGGNLDAQNFNVTNIELLSAQNATFGGASTLRSFNIYGSGLNGRLSIQGPGASNPGVEFTTDGNTNRVLLRAEEVGTSGLQLQLYTEPDGGSITNWWTFTDDGVLDISDGTDFRGIRLNSTTNALEFENSSGSWVSIEGISNGGTDETEVESWIFDADNTGNLETSGTIIGSNIWSDSDSVALGVNSENQSAANTVTIGGSAGGGGASDAVMIGSNAGNSADGASLVAIGRLSGQAHDGDYSTFVGTFTGYNSLSSNGRNTALGYAALHSNNGQRNLALGINASRSGTESDTITIGYGAGLSNSLSNRFILQQTSVNTIPLLYGDLLNGRLGVNNLDTTPDYTLDVNGTINADTSICIGGSCASGAQLEVASGSDALTIESNNYNNSPTINTTNSKDLVLTSGSGNVIVLIG
jgi:hypothetical protein